MTDKHLEIVSGRLGKVPCLAYTKKGNPVCELSVGLKIDQNLLVITYQLTNTKTQSK